MPALLLASASSRRASLLRAAGLCFDVRASDWPEAWDPGESPVEHARRLARAKAKAVANALTGENRPTVVLGADTVVWIRADEAPMGKPEDRQEARTMLLALTSGERPHWVTTAYATIHLDGARHREWVGHETTKVWMRPLTPEELEAYLQTSEWCDKAGGYGIQGCAASWVTRIEGSYSSVVGLPTAQLIEHLNASETDLEPAG